MADNTDEQHLNNSTNTESENHSDKIIAGKGTETIDLKQETGNMEVHHHPDLHHRRKHFKQYFQLP